VEISLEGKVALVTGVGPNIGSGIALAGSYFAALPVLRAVRRDRRKNHRGHADPAPAAGTAIPGIGPVPAGLAGPAARHADQAAAVEETLAELEHQILAKILAVLSGPGGAASFLRRNLAGQGLNGPSLPLDVGQTDEIPLHLRRLVALRDQHCQFPGGCDQPASGCEPHHVQHRADGGRTSLTNLKDYCWWHHHVVLHELGWTLTVHPDGTSQVQSPDGKIIRSHSPHPTPGNHPPSGARSPEPAHATLPGFLDKNDLFNGV